VSPRLTCHYLVVSQPSPLSIIVVDTTTIWPDLLLKKAAWDQLLALCSRGQVRLCVPEVVILEASRHYRREVRKATRSLNQAISDLRDLDLEGASSPLSDVAEEFHTRAKRYETYLRSRIKDSSGEVLPLPALNHEELLKRDLAQRKPFKENGSGYRDALIWATIVELCVTRTPGGRTILVTKNSKDFLGSDGNTLSTDLADDLRKIGFAGSLEVFADLASMLQDLTAPAESPGYDIPPPISMEELVTEAVLSACQKLAGQEIAHPTDERSRGIHLDPGDVPDSIDDISIEYAEPDSATITWQVYDHYEGGDLLVRAEVRAGVTLEGFADKSVLYRLPDDVSVRDWDWNERVGWVSLHRDMELGFHLRVNPDTESVDDVELESAAIVSWS
jgi:predicted nucleic acid-binding protein